MCSRNYKGAESVSFDPGVRELSELFLFIHDTASSAVLTYWRICIIAELEKVGSVSDVSIVMIRVIMWNVVFIV